MSKAFGKILLSGEHSVLYGAPAIGMTLNYCASCNISNNSEKKIECKLNNFSLIESISIEQLPIIQARLEERYNHFLEGVLDIKQVLENKFDIMHFVIALFLGRNNIKLVNGITINMESTIPIGSGMGSSAAMIISILRACEDYFHIKMHVDQFYDIAVMAENLQHGHSSGVDIKIIMHGGIIYISNGIIHDIDTLLGNYLVVHTGSPQSTTGQCVVYAKQFLANNKLLLKEFETTTINMKEGIVNGNATICRDAVRKNHRLLVSIGVVPKIVQNFIHDIEETGCAAKISGAGSVTGDGAGCVLILYSEPNLKANIFDICKKYSYNILL